MGAMAGQMKTCGVEGKKNMPSSILVLLLSVRDEMSLLISLRKV